MHVALCISASVQDCASHCAALHLSGSPCKFDAIGTVRDNGSHSDVGRVIILVVVVVDVVVVNGGGGSGGGGDGGSGGGGELMSLTAFKRFCFP